MNLIKSSAEIIQQGEGLDGLYKHIETCGRVPYKSEDKSDGTVEGAKAFIDRMITSKHFAVLEHGTVYLDLPNSARDFNAVEDYAVNKYSKVVVVSNDGDKTHNYVTTNFRVLVENGWLEDLKYICNPTSHHILRITFKVNTSIGVTRELNRHRALSILEQSTRYCNYSKDKFDNEIKISKPAWLNLNTGIYNFTKPENARLLTPLYVAGDGYLQSVLERNEANLFLVGCLSAEELYLSLIDKGWSPQQARELLPLCTATEAVYTGFTDDWAHFFELRYYETTGRVHPNMLELTTKMKAAAEETGVWNSIFN